MSSALRGLAPRDGLESLLAKMGHMGLLAEPRRGLQAGKSGVPRSQNADTTLICIFHLRIVLHLIMYLFDTTRNLSKDDWCCFNDRDVLIIPPLLKRSFPQLYLVMRQ